MLTADLVLARVQRGAIVPRWIDRGDPASLALAETLIDLFARHVGRPKSALAAELKALGGAGLDYLRQRGLAKLLFDRCELETESALDPPELRRVVFERAACAHVEAGPHGLDAAAFLESLAREMSVEAPALRRALYADLAEEQVIRGFDAPAPEALLDRYDLALAQAVLLRATRLEVDLPPQGVAAYRALFRAIKFQRLLFEVSGTAADGYTIALDGPLSLFQAAQKYGLQMALFLPALLHCEGWSLRAEVLWGKARAPRRFLLDHSQGLKTATRATGRWRPEEMDWFVEQFEKLDSPWKVSTEPELVDLGGRGVLVPDYVFTHQASGATVPFEVFGWWRRGALEGRLRLLREHGPPALILGVGRDLKVGDADFAGLPAEVYVFRTVPIAREVAERLERYATAPEARTGRRE